MITTYYQNPETQLMYKRISDTEVILLQVQGRDLSKQFQHRHEKVTFPSAQRLAEDIQKMQGASMNDWEDLMNEYLAVNKAKLEIMSNYRQANYENGTLRL